MANDQSRKAAGGGTNILIVGVSVLMVFGLMAWLFLQQQNRAEATVAEGDTTAATQDVAAVPPQQTVNDTTFEENLASYVGQDVLVTNAKFSSGLSTQTFWLELPTGTPYMVKLDSTMVAQGAALPTGGLLRIRGTVRQKDPALVAQWLQSGVIQNEDQQMQAEFGTTYLEARQIGPAGQ